MESCAYNTRPLPHRWYANRLTPVWSSPSEHERPLCFTTLFKLCEFIHALIITAPCAWWVLAVQALQPCRNIICGSMCSIFLVARKTYCSNCEHVGDAVRLRISPSFPSNSSFAVWVSVHLFIVSVYSLCGHPSFDHVLPSFLYVIKLSPSPLLFLTMTSHVCVHPVFIYWHTLRHVCTQIDTPWQMFVAIWRKWNGSYLKKWWNGSWSRSLSIYLCVANIVHCTTKYSWELGIW